MSWLEPYSVAFTVTVETHRRLWAVIPTGNISETGAWLQRGLESEGKIRELIVSGASDLASPVSRDLHNLQMLRNRLLILRHWAAGGEGLQAIVDDALDRVKEQDTLARLLNPHDRYPATSYNTRVI